MIAAAGTGRQKLFAHGFGLAERAIRGKGKGGKTPRNRRRRRIRLPSRRYLRNLAAAPSSRLFPVRPKGARTLTTKGDFMSTVRPLLRALAASSFLIVLPFAAAHAADPADVASRLKDVFAKQDVDLQWKAVSGDTSSMVLSGVTAGASGTDERAAIGDVTLTDVTEDGGDYVIGTASLPTYKMENDGANVSMTGVSISGLRLPPPDSTDPMDSVMLYDKAAIGEVSVKRDGAQVFDLANFHVDITRPEGGNPLKFDGGAESFTADLSSVDDPKTKAAIKALGYETLEGSFVMAGSWAPQTGAASLDTYKLTVKDAGTLDISFKMNGYTPEFIRSLHAIRKKIAEAPEDQKTAQSMALLGLLQQLSFGGATIRFDDDSLTGKVMDHVAQQEGMQKSDVANQAKAMLPFVLAKLNNPDLTAQVTKAVSAFLDDPKNLAIVAAPPNPVPLAVIAAGAMSAPQQLTETLGVKVIANQ
jgi:hypothetical protein